MAERIEPGRVKTLTRHHFRKMGLRLAGGYLILPTASELVNAAPGDAIVHIVNHRFQHIRWITMREAFKL